MNPAKTSSPVTKTAPFEARKKGSKTCHNVFTYDGYTYVRTTSTVNKNGSIMWRCENHRGTHKCKATCSTIGDKIIRQTNVHTCPVTRTQKNLGFWVGFGFSKPKSKPKPKKLKTQTHAKTQNIWVSNFFLCAF